MGPQIDTAALLASLRDSLGHRRISIGFRSLGRIRPALESVEPRPGAGALTGLVAQWVDAGFDDVALVQRMLGRFPRDARADLPLLDYLHLRMAHGIVEMDDEEYESALACFQSVLSFSADVDDRELFAIASFWAGRCCRKRGRYEDALEHTARGERLALECGYAEMAAVMRTTLSWLLFQKGRLADAKALLESAEEALRATDDAPARGNIQSAYGRIARREGQYQAAVERFERAIAEFRQAPGAPAPLARTLVNLAFAKRLLALRAQREIDRAAAARRGKTAGTAEPSAVEARARIEQMRQEAGCALTEAANIYHKRQNHRGLAAVAITEGFLFLDAGDLDRAAANASDAYTQAAGRSDLIMMARARTLQCIVEHATIEEQLGDETGRRESAEAFARDAVALAGRTDNRRLLARALVWQGLTFALDPAGLEPARRCCEQAVSLLEPERMSRQYVWEDLELLRSRVVGARPVERSLRAWSAGIVEGQSFQEITEEFARIVIPRVWEREGRKVSRVAEKLAMSPKKVRRILHAAGVTELRHD